MSDEVPKGAAPKEAAEQAVPVAQNRLQAFLRALKARVNDRLQRDPRLRRGDDGAFPKQLEDMREQDFDIIVREEADKLVGQPEFAGVRICDRIIDGDDELPVNLVLYDPAIETYLIIELKYVSVGFIPTGSFRDRGRYEPFMLGEAKRLDDARDGHILETAVNINVGKKAQRKRVQLEGLIGRRASVRDYLRHIWTFPGSPDVEHANEGQGRRYPRAVVSKYEVDLDAVQFAVLFGIGRRALWINECPQDFAADPGDFDDHDDDDEDGGSLSSTAPFKKHDGGRDGGGAAGAAVAV